MPPPLPTSDERPGIAPCTSCVHLFTTWNAARPRGCRAFGFETAEWPSNVVLRSSGAECTLWTPRPSPPRPGPPKGGRRPDGLYG